MYTGSMVVVNARTANGNGANVVWHYVGRNSDTTCLGNPFVSHNGETRQQVLDAYKLRLWKLMQQDSPELHELNDIAQLVRDGFEVRLACYCAPRQCHADVVKAAVEYLINDGRKAWGHDGSKLIEALNVFDYTFDYSDDGRVWSEGRAALHAIRSLINSASKDGCKATLRHLHIGERFNYKGRKSQDSTYSLFFKHIDDALIKRIAQLAK